MNIREIEYITIPVSNLEVSLRFYHEVFDMQIVDLPNGDKGADLRKMFLDFRQVDNVSNPISFGLIAKDSMEAIKAHLINYFVDIVDEPSTKTEVRRKVNSITILDPDKNRIEVNEFK
ncbi:VOC family protein [Lentilactobacillus sp. IMAU92037]|uniref:VOC family protein n=1 Tax=Lentilactobacillus TaxID=2767893 RepID=UPI001C2541EE|nr:MULTISPECIES: VOC family protein [Lentilactobacillus]MBU9789871.1 VOC family protein [Lentilactobacillus dabitei]MBV0929415.1 VOC family protein [Lentilactobacillus dabitei]MDM7515787.1 VOC family protein [Lentilactobacillus sp. TOM.63]